MVFASGSVFHTPECPTPVRGREAQTHSVTPVDFPRYAKQGRSVGRDATSLPSTGATHIQGWQQTPGFPSGGRAFGFLCLVLQGFDLHGNPLLANQFTFLEMAITRADLREFRQFAAPFPDRSTLPARATLLAAQTLQQQRHAAMSVSSAHCDFLVPQAVFLPILQPIPLAQ